MKHLCLISIAALLIIIGGTAQSLKAQVTLHPGDVNNDGIADFYDIVNLGVVFGDSGAARTTPGTAWGPYGAPTWGDSINAIGLDRVYADADGSGLVDIQDYNAILDNYGQTHALANTTQPFSPVNPAGIPIYIDSFWYDLDSMATYNVYMIISMGSAIGPAIGVDGFAMKIKADTAHMLLGPGAAPTFIDFSISGLGGPIEAVHYGDDRLFDDGAIEVASTRFSDSAIGFISGTPLITVGFVMEGNIAGGVLDPPYLDIEFQDVVLYDVDGNLLEVWTIVDSISLDPFLAPKDTTQTGLDEIERMPISIYPQPASDQLIIMARGHRGFSQNAEVAVYNVLGQQQPVSSTNQGSRIICDTRQLPSGNYFIRINTAVGVLSKPIQIK